MCAPENIPLSLTYFPTLLIPSPPGCLCCLAVLAWLNRVEGRRISLLCLGIYWPGSLMQSYYLHCSAYSHGQGEATGTRRVRAVWCLHIWGSIQITSLPLGVFTAICVRGHSVIITHTGLFPVWLITPHWRLTKNKLHASFQEKRHSKPRSTFPQELQNFCCRICVLYLWKSE